MQKPLRVLILKLASMGDLVHLLPALTDAKKAHPNIIFDWAVDKNFAEVASWHKAVDSVFLTNHREWRSSPFKKKTRQEFSSLVRNLRKNTYDLIIDAQGNIKTALLSCLVKGKTAGFDRHSIKEFGGQLFYSKKISSSKNLHAICRLRELLAGALDYKRPDTKPDYQINLEKLTPPSIFIPSAYLVFIPIASYPSKLWPDSCWDALIEECKILNFSILIPWGNEKEKQRALKFSHHSHVIVLPKLSLSEIAYLLLKAKGVVSMDTGFSHVSAALNTPCITLYGPTDPKITGTVGENQTHITSFCPCLGKRTCSEGKEPSCLSKISPKTVLSELQKIH